MSSSMAPSAVTGSICGAVGAPAEQGCGAVGAPAEQGFGWGKVSGVAADDRPPQVRDEILALGGLDEFLMGPKRGVLWVVTPLNTGWAR
jgi:hypothetical protein